MITIATAQYENDYRIKLKFKIGEEGIADLSDIIERYSIAAPLKILLNSRSFILTNGRRWFVHVDLIYHLKYFMNVQREIKLSGLKGNN